MQSKSLKSKANPAPTTEHTSTATPTATTSVRKVPHNLPSLSSMSDEQKEKLIALFKAKKQNQ